MSDIYNEVSPQLQSFVVDLDDFKIQNSIGEGGFGEVFLGVHKKTGIKCAIKKLFLKEMTGSNLVLFKREAEILAKCDSLFCLSFLGWTSYYPFSILTEFIPKGSLYNALRRKEGSPHLTATNKTIIAMGIAKGMEHLHSLGIIHRDLKSLNILLDDNLYPKICDFGLSRFTDESSEFMTQDVGTPHWMAPEIFESTTYTSQVDVYSYGMLVWEMLTESAPFKGLTGVQIAFAVCNRGERPAFPEGTPQIMKDFIGKCWHQDPAKRPSFSKIYKLLREGRVAFPDSNAAEIESIGRIVKKDEANRSKGGQGRKPPFAIPGGYRKKPVTRASSGKVDESKIKQGESDNSEIWPALRDPSDSNFIEAFRKALSLLNPSTAGDFFSNIRHSLSPSTDVSVYKVILPHILRFIENDNRILHAMLENRCHFYLPYGNPELLPFSLMIILVAITTYPQILTSDLLNQMYVAIPHCPSKVLRILLPFVMTIEKQENPWGIIEFLFRYSSQFISGAGNDYIQILYYLVSTNPSIYHVKSQDYLYALKTALTHSDVTIVTKAYNCLSLLREPSITIEEKLISMHSQNPAIFPSLLSFLISCPQNLIDMDTFSAILAYIISDNSQIGLLLELSKTSSSFRKFLLQTLSKWLISSVFSVELTLSIIVILCEDKENRSILTESNEFGMFISSIPEKRNLNDINNSSKVILKLSSNAKVLLVLAKNHYFKNYLEIVPHLSDAKTIQNSIFLIDALSRICYIHDFLIYIPYMFNMLSSNNEYTLPALSAITTIAYHQKARQFLKNFDFGSVYSVLSSDPQLTHYFSILHNRL